VLVNLTVLLGLTLVAAAIGRHFGRRLKSWISDEDRAEMHAIETSLLSLLALLLGFSFALSETRYSARRGLVVDEANAIGTARLRAMTIPGNAGTEIRRLLERYVDVRLAAYSKGSEDGLHDALPECEQLQQQMWAFATTVINDDPRSERASLLIQSINEVIDLNTKRLDASANQVPLPMLVTLIVVALVTMGWVGAVLGIGKTRGLATALTLSTVISLVVAVTVDLDRPRHGLIRIGQEPLAQLQRQFH
jgi:hypothetical protein